MLNDSKIAQLNSERPLHQTVVTLNPHFGRKYFNPGLFLQLSHILNLACKIEGTGRCWYFTDKGPRDTHDLLQNTHPSSSFIPPHLRPED